jgi:hypothetical protein
MAVDWALVVGPAVGAAIGLAGDLTGRLSARRQAERARALAIEDAARERNWRLEEQRQNELERRQIDLLEGLLLKSSSLATLPHDDIESDDYQARVWELVRYLSFRGVQVADPELRNRLDLAWRAIDAALLPEMSAHFKDYSVWEVVFTVRIALIASIGAKLRGDADLPQLSQDWHRLTSKVVEAGEAWRATIRREGFDARPSQ